MQKTPRVLVVDDEKMIREGCARILKKEGLDVLTADNGRLALELIRSEEFDVILLDIKMPEVDGLQVMDIVRQEKKEVLTIVITGYATIETAVKAMKAGAYDLLIKPFSADSLRIAVGRAQEHLQLAWEMERLKVEQARSLRDIANEQSRVKTIMNSMACGLLVTDDEKKLALVNTIAPQMLHLDSMGLVGRPLAEILTGSPLIAMIDQLYNARGTITALEQEFEIRDRMWVRARTAPVLDPETKLIGAVTVLADITHLKEMDRMKSEFVAMVTHELKGPLAVIAQQLEVMLAEIPGALNEKQTHFLSRAQIRAQGLIEMIDELLDLSRIEAGRIISRQEPVDLVPILHRVADWLQLQAAENKIEIRLNLPGTLPFISADPDNMDEVFMNVIGNAVKYTPEGGRVDVSADVSDDYVRIQVTDTGLGIHRDDISKIFDRFFRVRDEKTRAISGTGLGLSIVKGMVEAHMGSIRVESRYGEGTTFEIQLPLLQEQGGQIKQCAP